MMQCAPLLLLPFLAVAASGPVTVRVQETRGGPQIHVRRKADPPRFFFGSMNSGTIAAKSAWTSHTFEFRPGDVDGTGTLHFRFATNPARYGWPTCVSGTRKRPRNVLPPGSFATPEGFAKRWNFWPVGPANTVGSVAVVDGALDVFLKRPPHGNWPDFHLHSQASLASPPATPTAAPSARRPRRRRISLSRCTASLEETGTTSAVRRARSSARSRWPATWASTWFPSPLPTAGRRPKGPSTGRRWTTSAGRSLRSTRRSCSSRASPPTPRTGG